MDNNNSGPRKPFSANTRGRNARMQPYARPSGGAPEGSWKHDLAPTGPRKVSASATSNNTGHSDKITVSNLHYEVTPEDLVKIFGAIGNLAGVPTIRYDRSGRSLGVAQVAYANANNAAIAKSSLDGKIAKGKPMSITLDRPTPSISGAPTGPRGSASRGGNTLLNRLSNPPLIQRLSASEAPKSTQTQQQPQRNRPPRGPKADSRPAAVVSTAPRGKKPVATSEDLDRELEAYIGADASGSGEKQVAPVIEDAEMEL